MPVNRYIWFFASLASATAACDLPAARPGAATDILATVNGVPIRRADVMWRAANQGHRAGPPPALTPETTRNLLDALIDEELVYERALALHLDSDPSYQERLHQIEAQANAAKRRELGELLLRDQAAGQSKLNRDDVRKYYDAHAEALKYEVHIFRILRRSADDIEQAADRLAAGESFEKVAMADLPPLPAGASAPYDLGYLNGLQLPESWRDVAAALQPGQASGILRGEGGRYWIIKLVDRREGQGVNFAAVESALTRQLEGTESQHQRAAVTAELREAAHIEYTADFPQKVEPNRGDEARDPDPAIVVGSEERDR